MTEISFHTHVPDVLDYACRLLRKAYRQGARLAVVGEPGLLAQLDRALWVSDPQDFLPHLRVAAGDTVAETMRETPVWLLEPGATPPAHEVMVNLGTAPVTGYESFARLIEVVGVDDEAARQGRLRWRHYSERGYAITHHPYRQG